MIDSFGFDQARRAQDFVVEKMGQKGMNPEAISDVVITGSGLGGFAKDHMDSEKANQVSGPLVITFDELWEHLGIPKIRGGVAGHAKRILIGPLTGTSEDNLVLLQDGREHPYEMEGDARIATKRATFWLRVAQLFEPKFGIASNASGIVTPETLSPNDLLLVHSVLDTKDDSPLNGYLDPRFGTRFPHKSGVFGAGTRTMINEEARKLDIDLKEGLYIRKGPTYESPEEVYDLRSRAESLWKYGRFQPGETRFMGEPTAGVGMSSTYEMEVMTHAARPAEDHEFSSQGMEIERHIAFAERALLSVATNYSASLGSRRIVAPSNHGEVKESGASVQEKFGQLVRSVLLKRR